jgi:hypothetical protein
VSRFHLNIGEPALVIGEAEIERDFVPTFTSRSTSSDAGLDATGA